MILRDDALVLPDFACFKVTLHCAAFFGATRFFPLILHPPDELQVCFPLPIGFSSDVSDTDFPRRSVLVTTEGVVTAVFGTAAVGGLFLTAMTGAENEILGNLTFTPAAVITSSGTTSSSVVPLVTVEESDALSFASVFSSPHCFKISLDKKALNLPSFRVLPSAK